MKLILLLSTLLFSVQTFACSCVYDYGHRDSGVMKKISKKVGLNDYKALQVTDFKLQYTALASVDPAFYGQCGCTSFVKMKWDVAYTKDDKACTALAVKNVWNNRMKVKDIDCK
jgi:hypothetical protein